MKKRLIFGALLIIVLAAVVWAVTLEDESGTNIHPAHTQTLQDQWYTLGTFASGATTPGVTERGIGVFQTSDPDNRIYQIKDGWNSIRLRVCSTTDGDSTVLDVFLANGETSENDHFNRVATLTWTTGTQTATLSGYEFADTLAETNANWHKTVSVMSPTGNYIAEYAIDVMGSELIGICPTTITNTAIVEITGF